MDIAKLRHLPAEKARQTLMAEYEQAKDRDDERMVFDLMKLDSDLFEVTNEGTWWADE